MATEIGAGFVSVYPDTSSFHDLIEDALQGDFTIGGKSSSNGRGGIWQSLQTGLGVFMGNMGTMMFRELQQNMGAAINRLDTLTNFPKVMQGFGYTAQEAEESINLIMDRLVGLPTTTQEMVQFTQALADSTGDLDLATRGALAFNDALLASGAPMADQTRAQRMFNRIVGSGTATVNQWSALMAVMPMQLGMTSRALLGAEASTEDLGNALRDGKVSIEDILRTMVELDEHGAEGMASFNEQAWNMAFTMETAMKLIPIRIQNMLAAIGDEIGRDTLMAPFLAIANGIKDASDGIVYAIQWVKHMFGDQLHSIADNLKTIGGYIFEFFASVGTVIVGALREATPVIITFLDVLSGLVVDALQWLSANGQVVAVAVSAIAAAFLVYQGLSFLGSIAGIVNFQLIPALLSVKDSFIGLFGAIAANPLLAVAMAIAGLVAALVTWIMTTEEGRAAWENFCNIAGQVFSAFGDLFFAIINGIGGAFIAFADLVHDAAMGVANYIIDLFGGMYDGILQIIDYVRKAWKKRWDELAKAVKDAGKNISKFLDNIVKFFTAFGKDVLIIIGTLGGGIIAAFAGALKGVGDAITGIGNLVRSGFNSIAQFGSSIWNGITSTIGNAVNGAGSLVSSGINAIRSTFSSGLNAVSSVTGSIFGGIQSTIGNALSGARGLASTAIGGIQSLINGLTGRTVDVTVRDGTPGGVSNLVSNINNEIKKTRGTTVDINVRKTGINGISLTPSYSGGRVTSMYAQVMAAGGTITSPTLALIGEAGYPETVIPNTPWGVRPLAQAISSELGDSKSGVTITGNNFYVRNESDITSIANELNFLISRQNGGRL